MSEYDDRVSWKNKGAIWAVTLCAWLAQALAARDFATADAISYLDIAYSCLAGELARPGKRMVEFGISVLIDNLAKDI